MNKNLDLEQQFKEEALSFHEYLSPGKIQVIPTKPLATQYDLSLAYSPGVAFPCLEIEKDPLLSYKYTARGNLVAVISNGSAVLGLGNIGPLASKPVMEGKGVLFKKFAGIDVFDIEINERDSDKLVDIIAALEPTFGGINLEDIKAPECFYIERQLKKKMKIPVFHDDQHGTAIIATAAILNSLEIFKKDITQVKLVCSGAGAAAIACLDLLLELGLKKENIIVCDSKGVVHDKRINLDESKKSYMIQDKGIYTLSDAILGVDIFLGVSSANVLSVEMLSKMAKNPIILALANPDPEIWPPLVKQHRPDAIICTGRSDFPNQVNNVLCFPFIFRGALDVGATSINNAMKLAAVRAIADLAKAEQSDLVVKLNNNKEVKFGIDYVIPNPFDPRLIIKIAPQVAKAAIESGIATREIKDFDSYKESLMKYVYKTNLFMRPIFTSIKKNKKKIILCDGENTRVLHALQQIIDQQIANPIIVGRKSFIEKELFNISSSLIPDKDFEVYNVEEVGDLYNHLWKSYYELNKRNGVTSDLSKQLLSKNSTIIGAMLVKLGYADGLICGAVGSFDCHFKILENIIGYDNQEKIACAINALILSIGNVFIADTYVNEDPSAQELAYIAYIASRELITLGIKPKIAFLSNTNFGSSTTKIGKKIFQALSIINDKWSDIEIDGEMQGDVALIESMRKDILPDSILTGAANLLIMPNVYAANISYNLLRVSASDGVTIGPILVGLSNPCHIVTPISSPRRIFNLTAIAAKGIYSSILNAKKV